MVESWVFFYIEDGWNYLMGSGYGNSFFISYGICTPRLFSSFPSSILFPLSSSFFRGGGTISRSCYSPFFLSFLLLSLL